MADTRDTWSGRTGFILATIGSAVGIGSIWKFPYEVGSNGGSAFLLFYMLGLVLIVVPLMFAEFAIGRRGRGDPVTSIAEVAAQHGRSRRWALAGLVGVVTGFLVLSFYSVIGGWTLAYAIETVTRGLPGMTPEAIRMYYERFLASALQLTLYHALFMAAAAAIVARGVARGIEAAATLLMPLLVVLMLALATYAIIEGDTPSALRFLFKLHPADLTARAALEALGLGFFSIGVGLGLMITYAAYSAPEIDLKQVAIVSVIADSAISLLAGLIVFPIVFAHGLDPASGAGLVFVTLPLAFAQLPFGAAAAAAFFALLFVAALTSAISMLEVIVALLHRRYQWSRSKAAWLAAAACFIVGLATVLSFNVWANWYPLARIGDFATATVFDLLDHATSNLLLPLGGLALSLFAGWAIPARVLDDELKLSSHGSALLRFVLRYVAPLGIVAATLAPLLA